MTVKVKVSLSALATRNSQPVTRIVSISGDFMQEKAMQRGGGKAGGDADGCGTTVLI
jgi:hypothetical protein